METSEKIAKYKEELSSISIEDKKLLEDKKKALCSMLPYGSVRGQVYLKVPRIIDRHLVEKEIVVEVKLLGIQGEELIVSAVDENGDVVDIFDNRNIVDSYIITCLNFKPYLRSMSSMTEEERKEYEQWLPDGYCIDSFDWLNAHHFDHRSLIKKSLAIKAPKDMYK